MINNTNNSNSDNCKIQISYKNINYQGTQIITVQRTNDKIVEELIVVRSERNSYQTVLKSITLSHSAKDIFRWSVEHCPPLYMHREDLYDRTKDIEHPLYTQLMNKVHFCVSQMKHFFYGREIVQMGGLNGQCHYITIEDLNNNEIEEINCIFSKIYERLYKISFCDTLPAN